jgi:predicted nucleotide-binding protein
MRIGIKRLEQRVADLKGFNPSTIEAGNDPPVKQLEAAIESTVVAIFGPDSHEYNKLEQSWKLDATYYVLRMDGRRMPPSDIQAGVRKGVDRAIALLQQAADSLKESLEYLAPENDVPTDEPATAPEILSKEVFVVHGHDDAARLEVCGLLNKVGLTPIVLHEQASRGMTVIEKLEHHSDVGFAVVLLTPDDIGGPKDGGTQPRARQNVIAELFYFMGKLGRGKVCAIKKGDLEIPSDIGGVVYVPMDASGGWKVTLLRELEQLGHHVDWGAALR